MKSHIESIFKLIPEIKDYHSHDSELFQFLNQLIKDEFKNKPSLNNIEPFSNLKWPLVNLGNINSTDFITLGEMILYSYYFIHKDSYSTAFDVGANFGSDSLVLGYFGYDVYSFEPDYKIFDLLNKNILQNNLNNIKTINKALSSKSETVNFRKVVGNETASHIEGERNFFGESELFQIETMKFDEVGAIPDLMKINIEGHEKDLVPSIRKEIWEQCDVFIELHGEDCAKVVYDYLNSININIFSQKINWKQVSKLEDMAYTHHEGYIFASRKKTMQWKIK